MRQDIQDEAGVGSDTGASVLRSAEMLRRQTAEAVAHLREQAARMHAGLPPDPRSQPPANAAEGS